MQTARIIVIYKDRFRIGYQSLQLGLIVMRWKMRLEIVASFRKEVKNQEKSNVYRKGLGEPGEEKFQQN